MDLQNGNGSSKHFDKTKYQVDSINRGRYPSTCSITCSQELFVIDLDKPSQMSKDKRDGPLPPEGSISSLDQIKDQALVESTYSATYSSDRLMMSQLKGYDPNRIPASLFSSNPGEWSVASNESLFSLHIPNGSLSRENFLMLYKSGELGRVDESIKPVKPEEEESKLTKTEAEESSHYFHPSLPPVTEAENMDKMYEDMGNEPDADSTKAAVENHSQEKALPTENLLTPKRSADGVKSTKSFAFPVFERNAATNRSINMKIAKTESEKQQKPAIESQEEQQPKTPKTSPKAGGSSWFDCFLCLSQPHGK